MKIFQNPNTGDPKKDIKISRANFGKFLVGCVLVALAIVALGLVYRP
jgi:hypothetical protein